MKFPALRNLLKSPQLTVIVPTFNRPRELALCLEGFAQQTASRDEFEVIVVDDGSTGSMAEVCRPFEDGMQLRFLRQDNGGQAVARNNALNHARGQYLLLYDDDLRPLPQIVERCLAFHRRMPDEGDLALLRFGLEDGETDDPFRSWAFVNLYSFPDRPTTLNWGFFWGGTTTVKRSLFAKQRYNPAYWGQEDAEFALRLSNGMDLRVHYDHIPDGVMTRRLLPRQVFNRFYAGGYYCYRLTIDYPGSAFSSDAPYVPEDKVMDPARLSALLASARGLGGGAFSPQKFKMQCALWDRASVHARAEGWLAARGGQPPRAPGSIGQFLAE